MCRKNYSVLFVIAAAVDTCHIVFLRRRPWPVSIIGNLALEFVCLVLGGGGVLSIKNG